MYKGFLIDDKVKTPLGSILNHESLKETLVLDQQILLPKTMGKGIIERTTIKEGMEVIISDIELSQNLTVQIGEECEMFELNYCLSGETICKVNDKQLNIYKPMSNACYFCDTKVHLETKANIRSHTVEIRMSPDTLLSYFDCEEEKKKYKKFCKSKRVI